MAHVKAAQMPPRMSGHSRSGRYFVLLCFLLVFLAIAFQVYAPRYQQVAMSNAEIDRLTEIKNTQEQSIDLIRQEKQNMRSDEMMIMTAREKYDYRYPNEELFRMIPSNNAILPASGLAPPPKAADLTFWQKVVRFFD